MATTLQITPTLVIFGPFDSRKRYLRAGNASANMPIVQGITFQIQYTANSFAWWRYSVAGYVQNVGSITGDATYTLVTT
jgi:hypothetical protein